MEGSAKPTTAADRARSRDFRHLYRLGRYLRPYARTVALALAALLVAAGSVLSIGIGLRFVIDGGFAQGRVDAIDHGLTAMLVVIFTLAGATFLRSYLVAWIGERVIADLRRDVYARVIRLSPGFFETARTGEVLSRLTADTSVVQTVIGASVSQALRNLLLMVGGLALLFWSNVKLASVIFVLVPVVVLPIVVMGRRVRALSRAAQDALAELSSQAEESLSAVRTVQAFAREEGESARFEGAAERAFRAAAARARMRAGLAGVVIALVFGAVVAILWLGGRDVASGEISAGELASFVFYAMVTASAVGGLSEMWGDLQRAAGAAERLFDLLDHEPAIAAPSVPIEPRAAALGALRFDDVAFAYPSTPDKPILEGFSLDVAPGERIALVGPSGAGKTTVLQLALRFYDPDRGQVTFDGTPLAAMRPEALRSQLAIVPQDPAIFSTTLADNIRYGRPEASDAEVERAARMAHSHAFALDLPQGYATPLGERGVRLSGGQRQRVAIARALLTNPALLLLDEATSALDAESERLVQDALDRLMENRTTIVVAHRLATVLSADRIVVMNRGRIEAIGDHASLMAEGGLYARLAALQFETPVQREAS